MNGFYPTQKVTDAAKGRWLAILSALCPEMDTAINNIGKHVKCPIHTHEHTSKSKSFRLFKDANETGGGCCSKEAYNNGFALIQAHFSVDFEQAKNMVAEVLQLEMIPFKKDKENSSVATLPATPKTTLLQVMEAKPWLAERAAQSERNAARSKQDQVKLFAKMKLVWEQSHTLSSGSSVTEYARKYMINRKLIARNLDLDQTLRVHESLPYYDEDGKNLGSFPALVAAIRDVNGHPVTLHRTYLSKDGKKASVDKAKKMMAVPEGVTVSGSAIRLGNPVNGVIGITEGIETALSVYRATGIPCWSAISAHGVEAFEPTPGICTVIIWADKDRSNRGQEAAKVLERRMADRGINTITMLPKVPLQPDTKSVDWNDVLLTQGLFGFPRAESLSRTLSSLNTTEVQNASA